MTTFISPLTRALDTFLATLPEQEAELVREAQEFGVVLVEERTVIHSGDRAGFVKSQAPGVIPVLSSASTTEQSTPQAREDEQMRFVDQR